MPFAFFYDFYILFLEANCRVSILHAIGTISDLKTLFHDKFVF